LASLLWGSWCHKCLLPGVGIDLSGISRLKACTWGSGCDLLLSSDSSGCDLYFSILRWYICIDDQDLVI
jgi:hypothetical protein